MWGLEFDDNGKLVRELLYIPDDDDEKEEEEE